MALTLFRRARRARRGTSAIEFALVLPVLLTVILGTIEFSWFISTRYDVQRAAREGTRVGATVLVRPEETAEIITDAAEIRARQVLEASGRPCEGGCLTAGELFMHEGYQHLRLRVIYPHRPLFPGMNLVQTQVGASFVMLTQQQ